MKYIHYFFILISLAILINLIIFLNYDSNKSLIKEYFSQYLSLKIRGGSLSNYFKKTLIKNQINACIIVLARNSDLGNVVDLIKQFESNFNKNHSYPYVLMNDELFTDEFKKKLLQLTNASIEFELIEENHWKVPDWIDRQKLNSSLKKIQFSINYRHMCRFYSGFFFRQRATLKYDYYLRLDTDSRFCQPIINDPFRTLINLNKSYGFILSDTEAIQTIESLWDTIKNWSRVKNIQNEFKTGLKFISNNNGNSLTDMCMFYNNFEIGRFDVFRNERYLSYFDFLDKSGGFFYERWVLFSKIINLNISIIKIKLHNLTPG